MLCPLSRGTRQLKPQRDITTHLSKQPGSQTASVDAPEGSEQELPHHRGRLAVPQVTRSPPRRYTPTREQRTHGACLGLGVAGAADTVSLRLAMDGQAQQEKLRSVLTTMTTAWSQEPRGLGDTASLQPWITGRACHSQRRGSSSWDTEGELGMRKGAGMTHGEHCSPREAGHRPK